MVQTLAEPTQTRLCNKCGKELPITSFRRRRSNSEARHSWCNGCRNIHERWKRLNKQKKELSKWMTLVIQRPGVDCVSALTSAMVQRFGGLDRFVECWHGHFERAREQRYGTSFILKTFLTVFHMVEVSEQIRRETEVPVSDLSDEALEDVVVETFRDMLREGKLTHVVQEAVQAGELDLAGLVAE